jgi:hypothetical protein
MESHKVEAIFTLFSKVSIRRGEPYKQEMCAREGEEHPNELKNLRIDGSDRTSFEENPIFWDGHRQCIE